MKLFMVDTVATIVFFTIVAAFSELVIAGIEPMKVVLARTIMVPVMVLTGRPYGIWRDAVFARLRPRAGAARLATDAVAFVTFQVPVYVATLAVAGAGIAEILTAVSSAIFFMLVIGRPFGLFLEAVRRWSGVSLG